MDLPPMDLPLRSRPILRMWVMHWQGCLSVLELNLVMDVLVDTAYAAYRDSVFGRLLQSASFCLQALRSQLWVVTKL
jgi:hypothetical protein